MLDRQKWIVALTGASGMKYGLRLLEVLTALPGVEIHLVVSEAGARVLREEEGIRFSFFREAVAELLGKEFESVTFHHPSDIGASIASGSNIFSGMVIVPCSMGTLAAIANGLSQNLIHRAADVTLKEGRKLILVPRETPLSAIHLENMLKLARNGVTMLAAMPGFYHQPASVADMVDMLVAKILDHMGIEHSLSKRWKQSQQAEQHLRLIESP